MRIICSIAFVLLSATSFAQSFLLKNEELVFSFSTARGKQLVLAKDRENKYMVYRFGTNDKIEFEFPEKNKLSWTLFTYSFYLRGGGASNEGEDLNYISFTSNDIKYTIYDTYYAVGNTASIGVKITDLKTKRTTDIKGINNTRKGTMVDFRDNHLLKIADDLDE